MSENSLENPACSVDEQILKDNEKIRSLHSMSKLQLELFPMLGINFKSSDLGVKEVEFYSLLINKIIYNTDNTEIRNFILTEKFREAAELIVIEIQRQLADQQRKLAA